MGQTTSELWETGGWEGLPAEGGSREVAGVAGVGEDPRRLGASSRPGPPHPVSSGHLREVLGPRQSSGSGSPALEACGSSKVRGLRLPLPPENTRPQVCMRVHSRRLDACLRARVLAWGAGRGGFSSIRMLGAVQPEWPACRGAWGGGWRLGEAEGGVAAGHLLEKTCKLS